MKLGVKFENQELEISDAELILVANHWNNLYKWERTEAFGEIMQYITDNEERYIEYNYGDVSYEKLSSDFQMRLCVQYAKLKVMREWKI